jgi:mono/diheme cytochrome c family protein
MTTRDLHDDREPVAERRPVPVLLIALLILLFFWGDMYLMRNGGDVGGDAGAFPAQVYYPYRSYAEIPRPGADPVRGRKIYDQNCALCHQPTGMGVDAEGKPPLAGSDWVLEEGPNRIIRIVLNGLQGPVTVSGKQYGQLAMTPFRDVMSDADIAAVLTYIRSTWGNKAPPVKAEEVKAVRDATAGRTTAWTAPELLTIPAK